MLLWFNHINPYKSFFFIWFMIVLRQSEVNLEKILERYKEVGDRMFREIELRSPKNGEKWDDKPAYKIHLFDWKTILPKIKELYRGRDFDLILIYSEEIMDRTFRFAKGMVTFYKEK